MQPLEVGTGTHFRQSVEILFFPPQTFSGESLEIVHDDDRLAVHDFLWISIGDREGAE
jgi:hypothetical protein